MQCRGSKTEVLVKSNKKKTVVAESTFNSGPNTGTAAVACATPALWLIFLSQADVTGVGDVIRWEIWFQRSGGNLTHPLMISGNYCYRLLVIAIMFVGSPQIT